MNLNENSVQSEKYLREGRVIREIGSCKIIKLVSILGASFFFFGLIVSFIEFEFLEHLDVNLFFLSIALFFVYLFKKFSKKQVMLENARLYVNNFKEDVDGVIKVSDLSIIISKSEAEIINNFSKLIDKGYIINCRIENKNNVNYILLDNSVLNQSMKKNDEIKEIVLKDIEDYNTLKKITCPNCGASFDIQDIKNVTCSFCRTRIIIKK